VPNYTESVAYAQERLTRIQSRYQHLYSADYYIRRAANSSTRRMTNVNKLRSWETVLREAGHEQAADYCRQRYEGLERGTITPPVRRRLARTEVARFERIPRSDPYATGPVFVEYEFTIAGDDV